MQKLLHNKTEFTMYLTKDKLFCKMQYHPSKSKVHYAPLNLNLFNISPTSRQLLTLATFQMHIPLRFSI